VELERDLARARAQLAEAREELDAKSATLDAVLNSRGWRLLNRYRDARNRLRKLTPRGIWHAAARRISLRALRPAVAERELYQRWIREREQRMDAPAAAAEIAAFAYRPLVSIVMPVYRPALRHLDRAIASVRAQHYPDWQLCICDDGSGDPALREYLERSAAADSRIRIALSEKNGGISEASNRALALSQGDFVGLLDHDDELSPDALFEMVKYLQQHRDADLIYSDEDKLDARGARCEPFFKPGWSPELMLSCMYICHFSVYRRALVQAIGGFRRGFEGSQDYDLALRVSERTTRVHHIPKVLYHWRKAAGSAAASTDAKPYARTAARRALREHLERRGYRGTVLDAAWIGHYRVKFQVARPDLVSIIIPTRDRLPLLRACVASIEARTDYPDFELIIVDNDSREPATLAYLDATPHRVVRIPGEFNFPRLVNTGAAHARGAYLVLLNNDTEVRSPEWMSAMLEFAQQPEVGAVGAKLLFPNGTLQHVGVVTGLGGPAGHPLTGFDARTSHYFGTAGNIRNYSAVTAACMMVRRDVFQQVGGFDERFSSGYNDVDFCLRVRRAGYRIVYTPYAELIHHESASRGFALDGKELELMQRLWGPALTADPYYNPNLSLQHEDFRIRL
jgi:GT2 family glycosyltransferase